MKMWKKAASVMLASAMVFSLAACGSSGDSGKSGGSSDSDTFKIGGIGPTTGDAAIYGTAVKNGIQLAVDEINAAGGINGKQIEYKFEDDQADSEKSVNAYNTLKDWGMQALIGTTTSTPCTAVVEETHSDNMFQLTPSATAVDSIQYDNAFRMCFSDPNQGSASADYIAENKLATKVAIIYNSSDTYSSGIYQTFATEAKAKGLDVVAAEAFTADNKTDFSVQIQKAKDAGAELVFLPIYYQEASLILAQANKAGFTPKWFGCDGMDGILDLDGFDASLAEDLMFLTPFTANATDEATQKFVADYKEAFGDTLAACGSSGNKSGGSSDSDTFKIGGIGPTTGDAAIYGTAVKNGIQLAVDEINAAGGINGKQIEYKFEDDQADSEKSVNAYNTLKDWGMQALIGTTTSTPCTAVVEETHSDNMFQLTPSATAVDSIQYDNAFRMCFSDPNQGSASADYIAENKLATKVAIIYNSSDTYSSGIYQTFATEAKAKGLDVVAAEAFTADNKTDFSVQIQKAKDAGAELVFLPIYYQEASLILAQANKAGFTPKWFGCDGMDGILDLDGFDASLAEDLMFLTPFTANATDEATQKFVADYKEAFGDTPIQFAADAYDCVYVIKAAAEKEDVTPDKSASDICDALKKGMTEITYDGLTGKSITWSEDGEPTKDPTVVVVKSGEYQVLQAEDAAE